MNSMQEQDVDDMYEFNDIYDMSSSSRVVERIGGKKSYEGNDESKRKDVERKRQRQFKKQGWE